MTVREHLQDKVNAWIAKTLWAQISTEKDNKTMRTHELTGDMREVIPWMMNRVEEVIEEFISEKRAKKALEKVREPIKVIASLEGLKKHAEAIDVRFKQSIERQKTEKK